MKLKHRLERRLRAERVSTWEGRSIEERGGRREEGGKREENGGWTEQGRGGSEGSRDAEKREEVGEEREGWWEVDEERRWRGGKRGDCSREVRGRGGELALYMTLLVSRSFKAPRASSAPSFRRSAWRDKCVWG